MEINKINKENFLKYREKHLSEDGKAPYAYAITQIIKDSIINKDYVVYDGGGPYNEDRETMFLKKFDVVVTFSWGDDPDFSVVMDEDLNCCDLISSDENGNLMKKVY